MSENTKTKAKKYYSFVVLNHCKSNDDKPYTSITCKAMVPKPTIKTTRTGKTISETRIPLRGVEKQFIDFFGEDVRNCMSADGTIWVQVQAWENKATRFFNCFEKINVAKLPLVLVGNIRLNSWENGFQLRLSITDFTVAYGFKQTEASENTSQSQSGDDAFFEEGVFESIIDKGTDEPY